MSNPGPSPGGGGSAVTITAPVPTGKNIVGGNGATQAIGIPGTAQAGDIALAFLGWQSAAATPAPPVGWKLVSSIGLTEGNQMSVAIYSHVVTASEIGNNVTFTTVNGVAWVLALRTYTAGGIGEAAFGGATTANGTPQKVPVRHATGGTVASFVFANGSGVTPTASFASGSSNTHSAANGFMVGGAEDFPNQVAGGIMTAATGGPITGWISASIALDPVVTGA